MHTQPQLTLLVAHARFVSDLVKCARCNDTDERDFIASKLWVTTLFARAGALIEPINLAIASALLALVVQGVGQFWVFLETLQNLTAVYSTLAIQEISTKKSIVFLKAPPPGATTILDARLVTDRVATCAHISAP